MRQLCIVLLSAMLTASGCATSAVTSAHPAALSMSQETALLQRAGIDRALLHCNSDNRWGNQLRTDATAGAADLMDIVSPALQPLDEAGRAALSHKLEKALMWRMVRAVIIEGDTNNWGVLPLRGRTYRDASGNEHPVLIYRTGFTPNPATAGSCFSSLLGAGGVRHVVNLFDGDIPAADLVEAESRTALAAGATYTTASDDPSGYGPWRDQLRKHADDPAIRATAMRSVARLIGEQILSPGGAAPKGNLHVHCGGGMHRTGMIIGVVERCMNHAPLAEVEAHYKEHVGWKSQEVPGGFEQGNLDFIEQFDCSLLPVDGAKAEAAPTAR